MVLSHEQQTQPPTVQLSELLISPRYLTEAQAGTGQTCRFLPASGAQCAGWPGGGRGGCARRSGSSHRHRSHPPSGCGRRRWWHSYHSQCQSPSNCPLKHQNTQVSHSGRNRAEVDPSAGRWQLHMTGIAFQGIYNHVTHPAYLHTMKGRTGTSTGHLETMIFPMMLSAFSPFCFLG